MDPKEEFIFMLNSFLHVAEQMYILHDHENIVGWTCVNNVRRNNSRGK